MGGWKKPFLSMGGQLTNGGAAKHGDCPSTAYPPHALRQPGTPAKANMHQVRVPCSIARKAVSSSMAGSTRAAHQKGGSAKKTAPCHERGELDGLAARRVKCYPA